MGAEGRVELCEPVRQSAGVCGARSEELELPSAVLDELEVCLGEGDARGEERLSTRRESERHAEQFHLAQRRTQTKVEFQSATCDIALA